MAKPHLRPSALAHTVACDRCDFGLAVLMPGGSAECEKKTMSRTCSGYTQVFQRCGCTGPAPLLRVGSPIFCSSKKMGLGLCCIQDLSRLVVYYLCVERWRKELTTGVYVLQPSPHVLCFLLSSFFRPEIDYESIRSLSTNIQDRANFCLNYSYTNELKITS